MTLFIHTYEWVLDVSPNTGKPKTATSRLVKPGERLETFYYDAPQAHVYAANDRLVWATWEPTYAIQPGRGQKAVGRFRVTSIERLDVRQMTPEQACREGFANVVDFLTLWTRMYDRAVGYFVDDDGTVHYWSESHWQVGTIRDWLAAVNARPAKYYDAWHLGIEVVK